MDKGIVLQMQSFSVHDDEGIRTVIFLPGCPLRCKWCANPETWTVQPKLAFYQSKCVSCGTCQEICPENIHPARQNAALQGCIVCGKCAEECPQQALKILCKQMTADEVVKKVRREEIFYRHSGGGVTFSGGEPTVQHEFLRTIVKQLDKSGINMWIETCGYFAWEKAGDIFSSLSHAFLDIKCIDSSLHKQLTGVDNQLILENAKKMHDMGLQMTIRIPCIKGANFTKENLEQTAAFMANNLFAADIELLPYHNLGKEKYLALKMQDKLYEYETPDRYEMDEALQLLEVYGIKTVSYK